MEIYKIENLSFSYPNRKRKAIDNVSLSVREGEFITVCGKSGCGKTTLLRLLKGAIAPHGEKSGEIFYFGKALKDLKERQAAAEIGFVLQNPEEQIVTDKVWHDLAFGAESLGLSNSEIRTRVSETAAFFGIERWFRESVNHLSGGQKQILSLASVMVMQPKVLILDEPTAQLDPIAASEFLNLLAKINREIGTTVILSEHRLEEALAFSDRAVVLEDGKIIEVGEPSVVGSRLKKAENDMYFAFPVPMRTFGVLEENKPCPVTIREGRERLLKYASENPPSFYEFLSEKEDDEEIAAELSDVYFRYEKNQPDIIKNLNLKIKQGEIFAILGGNGAGKTTLLSLICGINRPIRGKIKSSGERIGLLPQNPRNLFVKKTVKADLLDVLNEEQAADEEKEKQISRVMRLCQIEHLKNVHPFDLSGGEAQRAALAKVLLKKPQILLLDEPTKGTDAHFKFIFADILMNLKKNGVTVALVSHDTEFCAAVADRCAMLFDGEIVSIAAAREFFAGKSFYTTSANKMAREVLPKAITAEEIILAFGKTPLKRQKIENNFDDDFEIIKKSPKGKKKCGRIVLGAIFAVLFILNCVFQLNLPKESDTQILQILSIVYLAVSLYCLLPKRKNTATAKKTVRVAQRKHRAAAFAATVLAVMLTILFGVWFLNDRKYYFISLLIIFEIMLPFAFLFEKRKPKAREVVLISALCALAVASREAFFMLPQFKPVVAIVIVSSVCFGGEVGFLIGAVSGFVSNFFFGQGPWTPWQMFSFGIIGFIAGVLCDRGFLAKNKLSLLIFGFLTTFFVYGGIMNCSTAVMSNSKISLKMLAAVYAAGVPFDLIHALSTAFFVWFIAEPMIEKLERIKIKYGLIENTEE